MAAIGTVIDGKYEILKQIGKGGMSRVYLAMDQHLNKQWAVKEIRRNADEKNNEVIIQSLLAEANLMKKLDHPALPRIVDILDSREYIYVIMDYIEGEPLSRILEEEGPQPQEKVLEWARQLCEALDYLHTRKPPVIYRDMKPGNIMLRPDGRVKLIDFGIAREYKEGKAGDTTPLGTKGYAAPEQFGGMGQTDARTDIYSLGVTLYQLVTGKSPNEPPYEFYPIRYWNPSLSGGLENILEKCLKPNPADRYQSCAELLYDLNHYEEADDEYRAAQKKKLHKFTTVAVLAAVFLAAGVGGQVLKNVANRNNFDAVYAQAQRAADPAERESLLLSCIEILPSSYEAYQSLIDTYKNDTSFTTEEEAQLKKCLYPNLSQLQAGEGYGELAFELGKLYWYYYDYGDAADNAVTRMTSSIEWFEDALDYGSPEASYRSMAAVYRDIGLFNQNITLDVEEASDMGKYAPYWENLKELARQMEENPDQAEIVTLECYRLVTDAVETYARKFKADGVAQEELEQVLASIRNGTENLQPTTDKTEALKAYIMGRFDSAGESIANAFVETRVPDSEQVVER